MACGCVGCTMRWFNPSPSTSRCAKSYPTRHPGAFDSPPLRTPSDHRFRFIAIRARSNDALNGHPGTLMDCMILTCGAAAGVAHMLGPGITSQPRTVRKIDVPLDVNVHRTCQFRICRAENLGRLMSSTAPRGFIGFQAKSPDRTVVSKVVFIANLTAIQIEIGSRWQRGRMRSPLPPPQRLHRACESVFGSWRRYVSGAASR